MTAFYRYRGYCLCPCGGALPEAAVQIEAPFSPLVFLTARDPLCSRGFFAIASLSELYEPEGVGLLLPPEEQSTADGALDAFVKRHGASVLNTAFSRAFSVLERHFEKRERPLKLNLVGLGDVGGTLLTGLALLGTDIAEIGVYDPDAARCARYEAEMNQILPIDETRPAPHVVIRAQSGLFDCDALLFTASRGVPPLGADVDDVRMAQYAANRDMLKSYADAARKTGFCGLFAQISDPVDLLAGYVFLQSNTAMDGGFDAAGLLPEQVQGYGLGVMRARAIYGAKKSGGDASALCAYGPHGSGLVIANAPLEGYDDALSGELTRQAETANLQIRAMGYKPYIAPAVSSACVSVLRTLRGQWHDGAIPIGGAYYGCRCRTGAAGTQILRRALHPKLRERVEESYRSIKELTEKCRG